MKLLLIFLFIGCTKSKVTLVETKDNYQVLSSSGTLPSWVSDFESWKEEESDTDYYLMGAAEVAKSPSFSCSAAKNNASLKAKEVVFEELKKLSDKFSETETDALITKEIFDILSPFAYQTYWEEREYTLADQTKTRKTFYCGYVSKLSMDSAKMAAKRVFTQLTLNAK